MRPVAGQRWISETEPELGLGLVIHIGPKAIVVRFDSCGCERNYALTFAPLKRMIFKPGDEIQSETGKKLIIESITETDGVIYYSAGNDVICEKDISDTLSFSMPRDRLFAGITDSNQTFDLRRRLLTSKALYDASPVKGFLGGKVELIPHQFFIADTVASRYIPRVLLADETGLGKTIEACLILHKFIISHRIRRVIIIVPESLTHQWFIELYRRFNLSFMILDETYCRNLDRRGKGINPFLEHQLAIVSFDFLTRIRWHAKILDSGWDMVVVDEAHHISDNKKTHEFLQQLSQSVPGLMLLTATPEQMGIKNHFLHLKLLDPHRYFNFDTYIRESSQYEKTIKTLKGLLKKGKNIEPVLDSYGPGRVMFRNQRQVIKGFPKRVPHVIYLDADHSGISTVHEEFFDFENSRTYGFHQDPRILCLLDLIRQKEKILVISSSRQKALAIEASIANHISIDMARFDESMSLLQRDRNAVFFSREDGAKILIASEIGSEGRNFQFVHHLFLFDLPLNPELLEQRIGRLDRIGQKNDIRIHVPCIRGTGFEILARWYMDGLNLFSGNVNGLHLIYQKFKPDLQNLFTRLREEKIIDETALQELILQTKAFRSETEKKMEKGKNILLEMNSFKPIPAQHIIRAIEAFDTDKSLEDILIRVLGYYGIETDFINDSFFKLNFNDVTDENFPVSARLSDTLTFNRKAAILRDDMDFFSWDHPFVHQAFEYFITNNTGSCALAKLHDPKFQGILLETVFILECMAPPHLDMSRYLTSGPIHLVVDHNGYDVTDKFDSNPCSKHLTEDQKNWFKDIEPVRQDILPSMIQKSVSIAEKIAIEILKETKAGINRMLGREITRLLELQKINPDIREDEINAVRNQEAALLGYLSLARPRIDSLRLIRGQ
ncbi:MAG: SNF2-related protein [Desulfobacula sp.]|jgi:ATP-dependent helicase HepA